MTCRGKRAEQIGGAERSCLRGRRSETGATGASAYTLLVKRFRTAGIFVVDVRAGTEVLRRAGAAAPRHLAEIYPPYDIRPPGVSRKGSVRKNGSVVGILAAQAYPPVPISRKSCAGKGSGPARNGSRATVQFRPARRRRTTVKFILVERNPADVVAPGVAGKFIVLVYIYSIIGCGA